MESFDFESQFKGAIRPQYKHQPVTMDTVFLVTDLAPDKAGDVESSCRRFLSGVPAVQRATWRTYTREDLPEVPALLESIHAEAPGLVITYRNLREAPRHPRSSLGTYLDSLTQATPAPVLVLPVRRQDDPDGAGLRARLQGTQQVIVVTDHLTDDPPLVRYGAAFTADGGQLLLTHIEDEGWFSRYMRAIEKIPEIEDELAHTSLKARLLKDASDFIEAAAHTLRQSEPHIQVTPMVEMSHPIEAYSALIKEREVSLIVADAKDPARNAMSDLAYAVAIEFTDVPILLL